MQLFANYQEENNVQQVLMQQKIYKQINIKKVSARFGF
jgi:hypothetical protein